MDSVKPKFKKRDGVYVEFKGKQYTGVIHKVYADNTYSIIFNDGIGGRILNEIPQECIRLINPPKKAPLPLISRMENVVCEVDENGYLNKFFSIID